MDLTQVITRRSVYTLDPNDSTFVREIRVVDALDPDHPGFEGPLPYEEFTTPVVGERMTIFRPDGEWIRTDPVESIWHVEDVEVVP